MASHIDIDVYEQDNCRYCKLTEKAVDKWVEEHPELVVTRVTMPIEGFREEFKARGFMSAPVYHVIKKDPLTGEEEDKWFSGYVVDSILDFLNGEFDIWE